MIKAVAFDLDGTVYYGNQLIAGAIETIEHIKARGMDVFYFTNNSGKSRAEIYSKLVNMGVALDFDHIYTSSYATALYCREANLQNVFCIGSPGLITELKCQGIDIAEDDPQAVVVGLDPEFTYNKLAQALWHLQNGCLLVACNQDKNYPIENGRLMPGCGSIVAAILGSYDKQVDFTVGKPNTYMMELLAGDHGLTNQDILVVGDSLATDIEMAKRFGCQWILVTPENNLTQLISIFYS